MCGIAGIYSFKDIDLEPRIKRAVASLESRGPDSNGFFVKDNVALGHTRLSIIDTSDAGSQPFVDASGNYVLVFNGEFYNHNDFREELLADGVSFTSKSDTEVLLYLLIKYGSSAVENLNGCFAFAFYDIRKKECLVVRDRMGINPVVLYSDDEKIMFASEMKALVAMGIPKEIDNEALKTYFQLNYIPTNQGIFKNTRKLRPGSFLSITPDGVEEHSYYSIPNRRTSPIDDDYETAKKKLRELLSASVQRRLIADVPLGCFLSGGIDSSIITGLASQFTSKLNTFSVGFSDNKYFDETDCAEIIAKRFNTNHTAFKISSKDLLENISHTLDYLDEPFADSSALAVDILSKLTRTKVTVALSGDGADELFSGYNKHSAHLRVMNAGLKEKAVAAFAPVWKIMPKSRNSKIANTFRQLDRFASGYNLSEAERYWRWASIGDDAYTDRLLKCKADKTTFDERKSQCIGKDFTEMNDVLCADMHLVLLGDMLTKVDMMSMANSLEVRVPFLDHTVVDYVSCLPSAYKIDSQSRKKILRDTFADFFPSELLNRRKHGFEVPLLKWFNNELYDLIENDLLSEKFVEGQGLFNYKEVAELKNRLRGNNVGDAAAKVWALIVFQWWWKRNMNL